ncbi:MAG: hypothetical protein VB070_13460 [Clostridiaceae bacterium]|nr:hypothetical protein [Clostridiaceae bacterium]
MIAIFWLLLAVFAGWRFVRFFLGGGETCLRRAAGPAAADVFFATPWPLYIFRVTAAFWCGTLFLTVLTYSLAAFLSPRLPLSIHPLLTANLACFAGGILWAAVLLLRRRKSFVRPEPWRPACPLRDRSSRFYLLTGLLWLIFGCWLMIGTFYQTGSQLHAGYSVFSDFAPHTALVSSFSQGRNWPTEYPHFPNDGIAYHFLFFFLCGNLNYLGLPMDWAINLPSILGLVSFCLLLGLLALRLTGRRMTFLLAPLLLFCRSSFAIVTCLQDLTAQYGAGPQAWPDILRALWHQSAFIGRTAHDDWGLWGINVYANQRHFLAGLSLALIVIFLFLPDLQAGLAERHRLRGWFSADVWLVRKPEDRRRLAAAILILILMPYWHGSVLVSLLLILAFMALFSVNRLAFLAAGLASAASAWLQAGYFSGRAGSVIQPAFYFGFLADKASVGGILVYLLELTGLVLPLLFIAFWLPGQRRKILLAAFSLPLIFAFTISLTPDITVNHKDIIITLALSNIYVSDLLIRLWPGKKNTNGSMIRPPSALMPKKHARQAGRIVRRAAVILLIAALTATGLEEFIIVRNINQNTVVLDLDSPLVAWIKQNTRPDAVFVSAPYHYNSFYLSGRATWLGHAYYAWSAGHDTNGRFIKEQQLLSGCGHNLADVLAMIETEGLDYLLLDDQLRDSSEITVDEAFFDQNFPVVQTFPALGHIKIYNLRQPLNS